MSCSETALQYALSKRMSKAVVTALVAAGARVEPAELDGYPVKQLKALCGMYGLTKPGGRAALVALLCPKLCSEGPPPKKQKTEVRIAPPPAAQRCARSSYLFACATQARAEEPQRGANAEQAKAPFPSVPTHGRASTRFPPSAPTGRRGGSQAHGSAPATLRRQPRAGLRAHAGVSQAIAQLAPMFPSLSASAIADALGKAGGDVEHAADALVMAQVSRQPRAHRCTSGCDCTGTYCVIRWSCFECCST